MKNNSLAFIAAISWLIISTILLSIPGTKFPTDDWLSKIWFDKWVHIGLFSILVLLWCFYLSKTKVKKLKEAFIAITILSIAYGTGMEFVQKYFVVNRSFDAGDIVADAIGCAAGLAFSWWRYIKK